MGAQDSRLTKGRLPYSCVTEERLIRRAVASGKRTRDGQRETEAPRSIHTSPSGRKAIVLKVGSVVIDCNDFDAMFAFWSEALRYVPREPPEDDFVVLRDPHGTNVNVSISKVPERRVGKNRLHLDLYTENQRGEVERLLKLGARIHPRTSEEGEDFIVLEDPEGNLFCVIEKSQSSPKK